MNHHEGATGSTMGSPAFEARLVVDEADHKRTAALEAARQFDATPPPTAEEGGAVGNQAAGAAAMHSGEGSRQWAA